MSKANVRFPTLILAMAQVRKEREDEVGASTYQDLVNTYGLAILFAEIASITSRLKGLLWTDEAIMQPINYDRLLDLLIDLGNFTDFLYMEAQKQEKREETNLALGDL